jgi:hypothetical protein
MFDSRPAPVCFPFPATGTRAVRDWRGTGKSDHFVQLYHTDEFLIECLAGFISDGIWKSERAIIIATAAHRNALEERLRQKGVDVASSIVTGQYLALDAQEMLAKFMVEKMPDREAFNATIGRLIEDVTGGGRQLRAFGEMVALLWTDGNREAAIALEQLWNDLSRKHPFALFCAYPASCSGASTGQVNLEHICSSHSCVISMTG